MGKKKLSFWQAVTGDHILLGCIFGPFKSFERWKRIIVFLYSFFLIVISVALASGLEDENKDATFGGIRTFMIVLVLSTILQIIAGQNTVIKFLRGDKICCCGTRWCWGVVIITYMCLIVLLGFGLFFRYVHQSNYLQYFKYAIYTSLFNLIVYETIRIAIGFFLCPCCIPTVEDEDEDERGEEDIELDTHTHTHTQADEEKDPEKEPLVEPLVE
eukprot:GHVR01149105.1.p1 GENE.GHVR01149105.1~~GHVR01149105.1.p1  ORF type:complete len:215 (+),score=57.88 GHVR01149105.1:90-734(+)